MSVFYVCLCSYVCVLAMCVLCSFLTATHSQTRASMATGCCRLWGGGRVRDWAEMRQAGQNTSKSPEEKITQVHVV